MTSSKRSSAPPDAAFLKLALRPHRRTVVEAVAKARFAASVLLELPVAGVPGVAKAAVFVWPEPVGPARRVLVDVVRLDARVLERAVSFNFELKPSERPSTEEMPPIEVGADEVTVDATTAENRFRVAWKPISKEQARLEKEVQRLGKDGTPVFAKVDTAVYSYRMTCACGRVRYAQANSIHQIFACRVCTRAERLRKRALSQYRARHGRPRART